MLEYSSRLGFEPSVMIANLMKFMVNFGIGNIFRKEIYYPCKIIKFHSHYLIYHTRN